MNVPRVGGGQGVGRGYSAPQAPPAAYGRPVRADPAPTNGQQAGLLVGGDRRDVKQSLGFTDTSGVYEVDHLATFTLPPNQSQLTPAVAVRKLYEMDAAATAPPGAPPQGGVGGGAAPGGVFTMRVLLCVEPRCILVLDAATSEEMERFPVGLVADPACVHTKGGPGVRYNNVVLFTVLEDPGKGSPAEMHLFQCLGGPGQKVVDDIIACMADKFVAPQGRGPMVKPPVPIYNPSRPPDIYRDFGPSPEISAQAAQRYEADPAPRQRFRQSMHPSGGAARGDVGPGGVREGGEGGRSDPAETAERCINLLDHCFNDIEAFVAKIQQAALAYNELDRRKTVRGNKNNRQIGDGLLGMRSKPPPVREFVDILQKFKLSFILLARLKSHIRDPNAPELVHFLFKPLELVLEASRGGGGGQGGPVGGSDLAGRVASPLLTHEARDLLDNCLTTRETELWRGLGPAWTTHRDNWTEPVAPYAPHFYDGWQPPSFWLEDIGVPSAGAVTGHAGPPPASLANRWHDPPGAAGGRSSPQNVGYQQQLIQEQQQQQQQQQLQQQQLLAEQLRQAEEEKSKVNKKLLGKKPPAALPQKVASKGPPVGGGYLPPVVGGAGFGGGMDGGLQQDQSARDLTDGGSKAYRVIQDRVSSNAKELTVKLGEVVEVLDDSRNWWKIRNARNETGFAPKTILEKI